MFFFKLQSQRRYHWRCCSLKVKVLIVCFFCCCCCCSVAFFYGWGSTASRLQSYYEESNYFLPLSPQKFLVLIWSTRERWKAESTLEPRRMLCSIKMKFGLMFVCHITFSNCFILYYEDWKLVSGPFMILRKSGYMWLVNF